MSNVVKFSQFAPAKTIFNGLLDELFTRNLGDFVGTDFSVSQPAFNILENQDGFKVEVAAPGFAKENFKISLDGDILTISAEVTDKKEKEDGRYNRREFNFSAFKRSFTLPKSVHAEQISGAYEQGILTVSIPKREETKPVTKTINIA